MVSKEPSCLPTEYVCPELQDYCLPMELLCDGVEDCSRGEDEGQQCVNRACGTMKCKNCRETRQGPRCFCNSGYVYNQTSGECDDLDECQYEFCDQQCHNTQGSFICSCVEGYRLHSHRCEANDSFSAPELLMATGVSVEKGLLNGSSSCQKYALLGHQVTAMDFDFKNNTVCFLVKKGTGTLMQCSSISDPNVTWTVMTQYWLTAVEQIAKDWVTGNWYFADGIHERIFMCTEDGSACLTVVKRDLKRPKDLALDPTRGLMFYTDWSDNVQVWRAKMDGTNRTALVWKKIVHPSGLTLDLVNQHVYWGDTFLDYIERIDYDGKNRRVVAKGLSLYHVSGMDYFLGSLYVANLQTQNHSVSRLTLRGSHQRAHPVSPLVQSPVVTCPTKPLALHVLHGLRQPPGPGRDVCKTKGCEHFCTLVPDKDAVAASCACREGFQLEDGTRCTKQHADHFLMYANAQQGSIHGLPMKPNSSYRVMEPIDNLHRPMSLAYHVEGGHVYYSDVSQLLIGRRLINGSGDAEIFLSGPMVTSCEGLAVDWVGGNLYYVDDGRHRIGVVRLDNASLWLTLVEKDLHHPKAITLDPERGMMYWANWVTIPSDSKGSIEVAEMDGSGRRILVSDNVQWPNSLALDRQNQVLYWTDGFYDRITSISLVGSQDKKVLLRKFNDLEHPYGIGVFQGSIFWTESLEGKIMQYDKMNHTLLLYQDSAPVFDLVVYDADTQGWKDGECARDNGGCSDICLTKNGSHVCRCAVGRRFADDTNCEEDPSYVSPRACKEGVQFECGDGSCINKLWLCDGDQDCPDGSDEDTSSGGACAEHTCPDPSTMFQCESKQCILRQFECDGEVDCTGDNSDEGDHCKKERECPQNFTRCADSSRCIPDAWICDHETDCAGGSDEHQGCNYTSCNVDHFRCMDGRCIPYMYRCDNEYDCPDHSDELDCGHWCDPQREFKCKDSDTCLPNIQKCDGEENCQDGSDEVGCPARENQCRESEFACNTTECIPSVWACDGDRDCPDGSDEEVCDGKNMTRTCHNTEFPCEDGRRCIPITWKCDTEFDCNDNSDEKHCSYHAPCDYPNFSCSDHSTICLPPEKLCDGHSDCANSTDEGRLCQYNLCIHHDCSHTCHNSPNGYVCSCPPHKRLHADNRTCISVDICEQWGICSQNCSLTPEGHRCFCFEGYSLNQDGFSCKPSDDTPMYLILSLRHEIRRVDLRDMTFVSLVSGLRNTIAVDFHIEKKLIFWADVVDDKIYRGTVTGNTLTNIEAIIDVGLTTTEGLAIDWVADHIYWVESKLDQIEVAALDGSNRATLVAGDMVSPRAIVVDPRDGLLFWTDWDPLKPRILRCAMNGEDRSDIYDIKQVANGGWPNGLALDYEVRRLYWVDARSDSVHTMRYDGQDMRTIMHGHKNLGHPFALTLFEHFVYMTDWRTNSLIQANKFNGSEVEMIQNFSAQPFDLQVYHPKRQPFAPNPCAEGNGNCSHLCLLGPNGQASCHCPHRMKIRAEDPTQCIKDDKFLLFVRENEIRGVDLDDAHFNVIPSITVPFVENATAIDYDAQEERLYWTDVKRNVINSAYLNGTGVETIIDSDISNPRGFAIDWLSRNMYFSTYSEQKAAISVARLNGAFRTEIISIGLKQPNSIAIHPKKGVIFWSDVGEKPHRIMQANMDGSNKTLLVQTSSPASLAVDEERDRLYWISRDESRIYCCQLSQAPCQPFNQVVSNATGPISMTIYQNTIYFADTKNIQRLRLDQRLNTTNPTDIIGAATPNVYAMQVYDASSRRRGKDGCAVSNGGCEQLCLPKGPDVIICRCTDGFAVDKQNKKKCVGISSFLLYSIESEIRGLPLEGNKQQALPPISKISHAPAVDFHAKTDHIYWVDSNARSISRIKRDLSERQTIVQEGVNVVEGLAVDWMAGNIYWTDRGHDTVEVARLDGGNRSVILHSRMDKPRSIVVHPGLGYLFFADYGSVPKIERARLDGSERMDFVSSDIGSPYGLAVDQANNDLYWCDKQLNKIERVNILTGKRKIIFQDLTDCVALTLLRDRLYWADITEEHGSIKWLNLSSPDKPKVFHAQLGSKLKDVKVFDASLQSGTNKCSLNNGGCEDLCLYRGNGSVQCACSYGRLSADKKSCEDYDAFLLYSKVTAIESIHMTEDNPNAPHKPIQNPVHMKNVIGLTFSYATKRIFFSDIQRGDIQSVSIDGTGFRVVVKHVGSVEGLAFDNHNNTLYWTSYTNSSISSLRLPPDHSSETLEQPQVLIQLSDADKPRAIVLHTCLNRLYWTNWNDRQPSIQTAYLNGFKTETIISDKIRTPNGLTIDHQGQKLYWSDARLDKIERCNLDGSNRRVIVTSIPQHSFSIAVYGDFIYWTDWMLRAVIRANKYDGSGITRLKKNIERQPMALVAMANDTNDCTIDPCYKNQFGCDEICTINLQDEPQCSCKPGHHLLPDGKRCATGAVSDCPRESFLCEDKLLCVPPEKTCNGISDCLDRSDEDPDFCSSRRCPVQFFQCGNRTCIHPDLLCNGVNDCEDESDEAGCPCREGQFQCANGMCIPAKYHCDRDADCTDHSDEVGCNLSCDELTTIEGEMLEGLVPCNTTSACIYHNWLCDGSNDCWDNSDEENCNHTATNNCSRDAFHCDSGTCIPAQWRCDKDNDCRDNSDEVNCTYSCGEDQHTCNDSHCIQKTWLCDGHPDCPDRSDEHSGCALRSCKPNEFRCSTGRCIPNAWKCDGDSDCDDGADETVDNGCSPVVCQEGEFQCANRRCIRSVFYCDHDNDCGDDSDEPPTCEYEECTEGSFKCHTRGMCIPMSKHCDGYFNCPDHSDEANCTTGLPCGNSSLFQCANKVCVQDGLVCNGRDDCGDGSDEPSNCGVNECLWTAQCGQRCVDEKIGFHCECNTGYELRPDNRTCQDINECNTTFPCAHYCKNTVGRYICSCAPNYTASNFGRYCHADGDLPVLLVSNRYYIRKIFPNNGSMEMLTEQLMNSVAIDFDYQSGYIYWSDITSSNSSINRIALSDPNKTEVLHSTTVRNPDGLAVDWVGRNLYWCDKTTDTIEVSRLDGRYRKVIFRERLQEPRGLEVFPARGFLYFTDWGDNSHISRIHMDGSNWQTIIKDDLAWPNALTIDYITEKIFWADGSLDYIGMANLDGSNRRNVIGNNFQISHIFALTTFEDKIYWTDWEKMGIFHAHKFTGENITQLNTLLHRPMDIQVFHELRQVPVKNNPCENNGGCSHLCLLRPTMREDAIERVCACPENHYLDADKLSCISNCTSAQFLCNTTSKCIYSWWKCDGIRDCEDGSDEPSTCGRYHCDRPGQFQCKNASSSADCILPSRICDGNVDCDDKSDEQNCESYPCLDYHFKCRKDKKCISKMQRCDKHPDCSDGEDESNCPQTTCKPQQFQCHSGQCVPYVWHCDNDNDCGDWSDEPDECHNMTCKEDHMKCEHSGRCIPISWKCDGDRDCGGEDDTDEKYSECQLLTCDPTYFRCDNNHCIPGRWKCDFVDDCKDGSDERDCQDKYRKCSESEFRCKNGRCIHINNKCNDLHDCEDGSDEVNCNTTCKKDQFQCQQVQHCIPLSWKCDGDPDCADNTDEWNCTSRTCAPDEFHCHNTMCLPSRWQCDGDDDCGDYSDELKDMCKNHTCPPEMFRCKEDHVCIWRGMACDGRRDCQDGSDEDYCPTSTLCGGSDFKCDNLTCVQERWLCDGIADCRDGADEEPGLCQSFMRSRNCSLDNGECEHHCREVNDTIRCSCKADYILADDRRSCKTHNPCQELGKCSQICQLNSSFVDGVLCSCDEGYKIDKTDHNNCVAKGQPHVIVAGESVLLTFPARPSRMSEDAFKRSNLLDGHPQENPVEAMAVDTTGDPWKVFIITNNRKQSSYHLQSFDMNRTGVAPKNQSRSRRSPQERTSLHTTHSVVQDIAVDWVSKHVYRLDGTRHVIEVENYQGQRRKTVVSGNMDQPQSIEVDPVRGWVFWSDKGQKPRIEKAGLDGSNRSVLVERELLSPSGLALDLPGGWLYWADSKRRTIEAVHVEGYGRRLVHDMMRSSSDMGPPYKLDVFEDYLLVVTWRHYKLVRLDKWGRRPGEGELLYTGQETLHDVAILHPSKQKLVHDACDSSPCLDSQLCIRMPGSSEGHVCMCPDGSTLKEKKCDFDVPKPPCSHDYCQNSGNCSLTLQGNLKCSCPPRYRGDRCQFDVCQNHCLNGGTCLDPRDNEPPQCRCQPGYTGPRCNLFLCAGYCLNGGVCSIAPPNATLRCTCPLEFTGPRCEQRKSNWCREYCTSNIVSCSPAPDSPHPRCHCKKNFEGKKCEACPDYPCYNGGVCRRREEDGQPYCQCPGRLDPLTQCRTDNYTCSQLCLNISPYMIHGGHLLEKMRELKGCDCRCPEDFCKHKGNCSIDERANRLCTCSAIYIGVHCETCNCKNGGECDELNDLCRCTDGFSGRLCESAQAGKAAAAAATGGQDWIPIVIPIVLVVLVVVIVVVVLMQRRRRRLAQYGHKRIREGAGAGLNVNNPVYLRSNEEEPMEQEGTGLIYTGDVSTNFANPMYDVYNADSMQMLLNQNEEESNHLLDDGLPVRYSSTPEESVKKPVV